MAYTTYILECADGTLYVGSTTDVKRRVAEHNGEAGKDKGAKYTKPRRPVVLKYAEIFSHKSDAENKSDAMKREYELKQLSRAEKLALIANASDIVFDA
jgi:putative endonuclease